jgi:rhodanese-related sulfurtransferase
MVASFSLILAACANTSDQIGEEGIGQVVAVDGGGTYIDITPQELKAMMEEKDFYFVNVHIPYCRSGSMSTTAAREMVKAGYTNIFNLDGGFRAWSQAGFDFIE